jgi:hypothetical protein
MEEEWRPIIYPGYFVEYHEVSNLGRVRQSPDVLFWWANAYPGKILKECNKGSKGRGKKRVEYVYVYFRRLDDMKGAQKHVPIHRIVAMTFLPNPEGKKEINHKNGIKWDNRVENLEWCTGEENDLHYRNGNLKIYVSDRIR